MHPGRSTRPAGLKSFEVLRAGVPKVLGLEADAEIAIPAGGEGDARNYYGRILGLRERMKPAGERGAWFDAGGKLLKLRASPDFAHPGTEVRARFRVDDAEGLRKAHDRARFRHYDAPPVVGTRGFWGLDPFGNRLEFREIRN